MNDQAGNKLNSSSMETSTTKYDSLFNDVSKAISKRRRHTTAYQATILQRFLNDYKRLLDKEKELNAANREDILLQLKEEFEKMKIDHIHSVPSFCSSECSEYDHTTTSKDWSQITSPRTSNERLKLSDTEMVANYKHLTQIEDFKKAQEQVMKQAKSQMENVCALLDFVKIKSSKITQDQLMSESYKMAHELSSMKAALIASKSAQFSGKIAEQVNTARSKLQDVKRMYDNWNLKTIIVMDSIEQKKKSVDCLNSRILSSKGTLQKEELQESEKLQKAEESMVTQQFMDKAKCLIEQVVTLQSTVREETKMYDQSIDENKETVKKLLNAFDEINTQMTKARSIWLRYANAPARPSLSKNEGDMNSRLNSVIERMAAERADLEKHINSALFYCEDWIFQCDDSTDKSVDNIDDAIWCGNLSFTIGRLGHMMKCCIDLIKKKETTAIVCQKLETALAFSGSKLRIIKFDVNHKHTYLQSRTHAVYNFSSKNDHQTEKEKEMQNNAKHCNNSKETNHMQCNVAVPFHKRTFYPCLKEKKLGKLDFGLHESIFPKLNSSKGNPEREKASYTPMFFSKEKSYSLPIRRGSTFYSNHAGFTKSVLRENAYELVGHQNCVEDFLARREEGICDMANHFRFYDQQYDPSKPQLPTRFLFYTNGVGVFSDHNGQLVDAMGLPFPKVRKCAGKPSEMEPLVSNSTNCNDGEVVDDFNPNNTSLNEEVGDDE